MSLPVLLITNAIYYSWKIITCATTNLTPTVLQPCKASKSLNIVKVIQNTNRALCLGWGLSVAFFFKNVYIIPALVGGERHMSSVLPWQFW